MARRGAGVVGCAALSRSKVVAAAPPCSEGTAGVWGAENAVTEAAAVYPEEHANNNLQQDLCKTALVFAFLAVGPGRYCSPRHRMPFNVTHEGSNSYP